MNSEQEHSLKLKCLEIAAKELIEIKSELRQTELMKRAKQLYQEAKIRGFENWNAPEIEETVQAPTPPPIQTIEGSKMCPKCGEAIPIKFKRHKFKMDASECGWSE